MSSATLPSQIFFGSLLPFFEPFLSKNNGSLLSISDFLAYANTTLHLPISRDIAEIFISRMSERKWLLREHSASNDAIWKINYTSNDEIDSRFRTLESDLGDLFMSISEYATQHFPHKTIPPQEQLEDDLLSFLLGNFTTNQFHINKNEDDESDNGDLPTIPNEESWHYIFARYINYSEDNGGKATELIERLTGVALIAEALAELRAPGLRIGKSKLGSLAYIDAPLLMARLGLSGKAAEKDAAFMIEKLREANIQVECLHYACDEIRDNLKSMLANPISRRTGPTAEALRRGEIQEVQCAAIAADPDHYIQSIAGINVRQIKTKISEAEIKHLPSVVVDVLASRMPSVNPTARLRDAQSIAMVMRKRAGQETRHIFDSKAFFITSNPAVVGAAIHALREREYLSDDKRVIGPAVTARTISGLIFANAGTADRKEISRRQLLGACSRVVALRPRIVDQVRAQFSQLAKIEDKNALNALLTQPRGAEVFMDYLVGEGRTISPENHDELLQFMKQSLVENELRAAEKVAQEKDLDIKKLEQLLDASEAGAALLNEESKTAIATATQRKNLLEEKILQMAIDVAQRSVSRARRTIYIYASLVSLILLMVFIMGGLHNNSTLGYVLGLTAALLSVAGLIVWVFGIEPRWVDRLIRRVALRKLRAALTHHGLAGYAEYFDIAVYGGKVDLLAKKRDA